MKEDPTMATAKEAAQRVYSKRLAANRESMKRKHAEESQQQRENRLAADMESKKTKRDEESQEQRENRLTANRGSMKRKRAEEPQQQRENRLASQREITKRKRAEESQQKRENRLASQREITKRKRAKESQEQPGSFHLAFRYSPFDDYSLFRCVQIGTMSKICPYCKALKFNGETMGMCCASGKVKLPLLAAPPEPLKTFLTGTMSESKHILSKIRKYN